MDLARRLPETAAGGTLLVDGRRVPAPDATFANACLMHIRTQDDFYSGANAHLGAVIIPAALGFRRPKAITFLPDLPKNPYGKVLRQELRKLLGARVVPGAGS